MDLLLKRSSPIKEALPGELFLKGEPFLCTLERVAVAIPLGRYKLGLYPSPHFNRLMPIVLDVPGRSDILLHWGNYPENSDGCILVGLSTDGITGDIFNTRAAFDSLFRIIQPLIDSEGVWITLEG